MFTYVLSFEVSVLSQERSNSITCWRAMSLFFLLHSKFILYVAKNHQKDKAIC